MAESEDNESSTLSIYIPVTVDGTRLVWDGNPATLPGMLYEVQRYYKRKGLFQPELAHRAVALSNGRLAIEAPAASLFTTGVITDGPHGFDDPCPPTARRVERYNEEVAAGTREGGLGAMITPTFTVAPEHKTDIIVAEHLVTTGLAKLLSSLEYVFGQAASSEAMLEEADGDGNAFLGALWLKAEEADANDIAVVTATFHQIVRDGVKGELTLESVKAFLKEYKAAKRNVQPDDRPKGPAEANMISLIAISDPSCREMYQIKSELAKPATLEAASKILLKMLESRVRCEEIDAITSGRGGAALVVGRPTKPPPPAAPAQPAPPAQLETALAAVGIDVASLKPAQLTALVAALAPKDPRKTGAGADKDKVKVPRGADGKPNKWVNGMALCRCGVGGGKHLFKDCPKAKEKAAAAAAAAKEAAEKAAGGKPALAAAGVSEDQLRAALASVLAGMLPPVDPNKEE